VSKVKAGVRGVPAVHSIVGEAGICQPGQSWEPWKVFLVWDRKAKNQRDKNCDSCFPLNNKKKKKVHGNGQILLQKIFNTSFCFIPFEYFL